MHSWAEGTWFTELLQYDFGLGLDSPLCGFGLQETCWWKQPKQKSPGHRGAGLGQDLLWVRVQLLPSFPGGSGPAAERAGVQIRSLDLLPPAAEALEQGAAG